MAVKRVFLINSLPSSLSECDDDDDDDNPPGNPVDSGFRPPSSEGSWVVGSESGVVVGIGVCF